MTRAALGIDLGVSGVRAAVVDENGRLLGRGRTECTHINRDQVGRAEHDPTLWFIEAVNAARLALTDAGEAADSVQVIGIGALGPCPVLLDADLKPLAPAPLFSMDTRAEGARLRLLKETGLGDDALGPDHVAGRLRWWRDEAPNVLSAARWVVDATGFLVGALTGMPVIDRITAADHIAEGIEALVPSPEPRDPTAIAGGLTEEAAAALGLPPRTPVATGTYDTYVDLAGCGVRDPGDAGVLLGSTLILGAIVEQGDAATAVGAGLRLTPHLGRGSFLGGWTSAAGGALSWAEKAFAPGDPASVEPGAGGMLFFPGLDGERAPVWDPFASGVLVGFRTTTTPAHLRRAVLDGVALSALDLALRLATIADSPATWRAGGGGVNDPTWTQAIADALGAPLEVVAHAGEAVPAALLALAAVGIDVKPAVARVVTPNPAATETYALLLPRYRELYPALATTMHALADPSGQQ